jgi:hypothetical protein
MTTEEAIERVVEATLAPIRDIGVMLAKEIDKTNARLDDLEGRINEAEGREIALAEGRRP